MSYRQPRVPLPNSCGYLSIFIDRSRVSTETALVPNVLAAKSFGSPTDLPVNQRHLTTQQHSGRKQAACVSTLREPRPFAAESLDHPLGMKPCGSADLCRPSGGRDVTEGERLLLARS